MPLLKVDLQEGFSGRTIVLLLNDKEVYRGAPKTRQQIGLADSRSFELPSQNLKLKVVTESGVSKDIELELSRDMYVGVSLSPDGEPVIRSSTEPFGYL